LNEAVDQVRREESQQLSKQGDKTLVGSKFSWLRNPENMSSAQRATFDLLMEAELKTGVAWSIKNGFRKLWDLPSQKHGEWYFWYWSLTVDRSGLVPLIKVKEMLERHRDNLMNWFNHRVSNAVSEGLKSKIQSLKSAARGFHNFESYQTRILFFCGKLNMQIAAVT
jgi:transposase